MKRLVAPLIALALTAPLPVLAHENDAVFDSYEVMRAVMDALIKAREVEDLMLRFGGAHEMTTEQLQSLDAQVEQIYPEDFENTAVLRRDSHENGFA
jgi:hypothetical protein